MLEKVFKTISDYQLIEDNDTIVAGISGGADSICLLHILYIYAKQHNDKIIVVHINHMIRDEEAKRDQSFVEQECKKLGVIFETENIDVKGLAKAEGISTEEAGRKARYTAFERAAKRYQANCIAVAHNANDNVETILLNLCRGTGIKGATGIDIKRDMIIRPLLNCTRKEIEEYLENNKIQFVTDSTNLEIEYTRNKVRNVLIPYMTENINAQTVAHITEFSKQLTDIEEYLESSVNIACKKYLHRFDNSWNIRLDGIDKENKYIKSMVVRKALFRVAGKLKDITKTHINDCLSLIEAQTGRQVDLPYGMICQRQYEYLRIFIPEKNEEMVPEEINISITKLGIYKLPDNKGIIEVEVIDKSQVKNYKNLIKSLDNNYTKLFDYDILNNSLILRTQKHGDFITITADCRYVKKKLKDLVSDIKIPKDKRRDVLVLADKDEVMWLLGYRRTDKYLIDDNTEKVIKIQYRK